MGVIKISTKQTKAAASKATRASKAKAKPKAPKAEEPKANPFFKSDVHEAFNFFCTQQQVPQFTLQATKVNTAKLALRLKDKLPNLRMIDVGGTDYVVVLLHRATKAVVTLVARNGNVEVNTPYEDAAAVPATLAADLKLALKGA